MIERLLSDSDLESERVLYLLFSVEILERLAARMATDRDADDLIAHPLQAPILIAYREPIASLLSHLVPAGRWYPRPAYLCLSLKRSGGYRELVFPSLLDSIVGRCIIDALEPKIVEGDGEHVFYGRAHASANRSVGDYEHWFSMWRDYSAAIAAAAARAGFTYVYDTDVSDFFPSIDRTRAQQFLARRTRAHPSLLALLFSCLEAWLPRLGYTQMTGLPIENNDVSRLVAHNYLKEVDSKFVTRSDCVYLRYVDDTVIFASSKREAERIKREHHLALRSVGLNPNSAKSAILPAEEFEARRHREMNRLITEAEVTDNVELLQSLIEDWLSQSERAGWEPVMRRLYSAARRRRLFSLRSHVAGHIERYPTLAEHALSYLARFDITKQEAEALLGVVKRGTVPADVDIRLARFFSDAVFADQLSRDIANMAILRILREEVDHGLGYARGVWLLALHKHGHAEDRKRILGWSRPERLIDEQFRLHYMYVFTCTAELPEAHSLWHLGTPDIELTLKCCQDARDGRMPHREKVLERMVRSVNGRRTIAAAYLPLLRLILKAPGWERANIHWLRQQLEARPPECQITKRFLERRLQDLLE